jgi:catechol 2,3-dioxygenase-like lactoylglutathione lyase family enzyme
MSPVERLDHVGVTVDDLEAATAFFLKLGIEQERKSQIVEGDWVDSVVGRHGVRAEVVMLQAPNGGGTRLELKQVSQTRRRTRTASCASQPAGTAQHSLRSR